MNPNRPSSGTPPAPWRGEGQYIAVCMGCGEAIKKHQKALRVRDPAAMDFEEREPVDILLIFCPDCRERIKKWIAEGIRPAVERMKEKQKTLQLLDKKDREALSQVEEGL